METFSLAEVAFEDIPISAVEHGVLTKIDLVLASEDPLTNFKELKSY